MNEADLHAISEQHGSVQLLETRSFVHELHVKVDSIYFTGKHYPLPVPKLPPNVGASIWRYNNNWNLYYQVPKTVKTL